MYVFIFASRDPLNLDILCAVFIKAIGIITVLG